MSHGLSAVVSARCYNALNKPLHKHFDFVFALPADRSLAPQVADHPDMIVSFIGDDLIVPSSYYSVNSKIIDSISSASGCKLVKSNAPREKNYPSDISLNALITPEYIFGKLDCLSCELLSSAHALDLKAVNVKQGYASCSAIYAGGIVITSDPSIAKTTIACGIRTVTTDASEIVLSGYDHGLIGGCAGAFENMIYFTGDPKATAGTSDLISEISPHNLKCISLSDGPLVDFGGIKLFKTKI